MVTEKDFFDKIRQSITTPFDYTTGPINKVVVDFSKRPPFVYVGTLFLLHMHSAALAIQYVRYTLQLGRHPTQGEFSLYMGRN